LSLLKILQRLPFGLLIFDRYRGATHFRILPDKIKLGTIEGFISGIDLKPRLKSGIFKGIPIDETDRRVLLIAYRLQKIWGNPDGMSLPPSGMSQDKWDRVKENLSIGTREDNYILILDDLKKIFEVIDRIEKKEYFSDPKKRELFNKMIENKYDSCFIDNTFIAGTGAICEKCKDIISKAFFVVIPSNQVGKVGFEYLSNRFQLFIEKLRNFNSFWKEKDWY
jgi:hypothetical protein